MVQPLLPEYLDSKQETPQVKIAGLADLEDRIDSLERELAGLKVQMTTDLRLHSQENLQTIFRLLSPFYKGLKPIFGEFEAAGVEGGIAVAPQPSTGKQAQWESVKQRLQPRHRQVIDVLLLQGEMTRREISFAIKMNYTNCVNNVIGPLIRQGWLVESGGKVALKNL